MILSQNSLESFEKIKDKQNESKLTDNEFLLLNEVYSEITKRPITKGCNNCLLSAWKIIENWKVRFYEETKSKYAVEQPKVKRTRKPKA
jgi:hypothetical protein